MTFWAAIAGATTGRSRCDSVTDDQSTKRPRRNSGQKSSVPGLLPSLAGFRSALFQGKINSFSELASRTARRPLRSDVCLPARRDQTSEPSLGLLPGARLMTTVIADVREMLSEQVQYRELLYQMTRRDLLLRYKQTI